MDKFGQELQAEFGEQRIRTNEPLEQFLPNAPLRATFFLTVNSREELIKAVTLARTYSVDFVLFDQMSFSGSRTDSVAFFIKNDTRKFDIAARKGKIQSQKLVTDYALVEAESGVPFSQLVRFTIDEGLGGLEYGMGLSGTVGRVLHKEKEVLSYLTDQNILQSVTILTQDNEIAEVSITDLKPQLIVLSAVFKLRGEDSKILWLKGKKAAEQREGSGYPTV